MPTKHRPARQAAWAAVFAIAALAALTASPGRASAQKELLVGFCARTISAAAAPFAIAAKLGWFAQEGITVRLQPLGGSNDCARQVATEAIATALTSIESVALMRLQGTPMRSVYTAYQGNTYGIAVPAASPIRDLRDLKGKKIGLISMSSNGAIVARALAAANGLDPDNDITLVVAGEGAQSAAMVRNGQVDALSQFDTQYAMIENAGVPLRLLDTSLIDSHPSNGFVVLESNLERYHHDVVGLARGYAKGTIFAINNPGAAVQMLWEVFPQTKPTGKDEQTALSDEIKVLQARAVNWRLEKAHARKWGEAVEANYEGYMQYLQKWGMFKQPVAAKDLISNAWIGEINNFDPAQVAAEAKAYVYR
jgi:NitT/TauT family transport system substrate-binding protein